MREEASTMSVSATHYTCKGIRGHAGSSPDHGSNETHGTILDTDDTGEYLAHMREVHNLAPGFRLRPRSKRRKRSVTVRERLQNPVSTGRMIPLTAEEKRMLGRTVTLQRDGETRFTGTVWSLGEKAGTFWVVSSQTRDLWLVEDSGDLSGDARAARDCDDTARAWWATDAYSPAERCQIPLWSPSEPPAEGGDA